MSEIDRKLIKENERIFEDFDRHDDDDYGFVLLFRDSGAGEEGILIDKPLLFGHGGVRERTVEMEEARAKAERQRAIADKAYMKEMNLTQDQFIMLKIVEKANPNIDVVMGGNPGSMWNIRR